MTEPVRWTLEPHASGALDLTRRAVAQVLHAASIGLARVARYLCAMESSAVPPAAVFEFHAEAGAPEGALYVNGHRIGVLEGVTRL